MEGIGPAKPLWAATQPLSKKEVIEVRQTLTIFPSPAKSLLFRVYPGEISGIKSKF